MAADYDVKMAGSLTVQWSLGQDEDDVVQGWIGVKPEKDGFGVGCTAGWSQPMTEQDDVTLESGVASLLEFAMARYLYPRLYQDFLAAANEMRERLGGYQPVEIEPEEG